MGGRERAEREGKGRERVLGGLGLGIRMTEKK